MVVDHPGPLEEYETHFVFTDDAAAAGWLAGKRANGSGIFGAHDDAFDVAVGDDSFGVRASDEDPQHETLVYIGFRVGRVAVQIDLTGGSTVSNAEATALASGTAGFLNDSCRRGEPSV